MVIRSITGLMSIIIVGAMAASAVDAASLRVKCEVRDNRSKASVDGRNLGPGEYLATISNGTGDVRAAGTITVAGQADEAEFDFDSDRDDIADGATAIDRDFLSGGTVSAKLVSIDGAVETSVAMGMAMCRDRRD